MAVSASFGPSGVAVLVIYIAVFCVYFLPTIIAFKRKVANVGTVFAINLFFGASLIGWVVSLVMALRTKVR